MKKILITRKLINSSEELATKFFDVKLNKEDKILSKEELIKKSEGCDGILSSITDKFDSNLNSYWIDRKEPLQSMDRQF